jgi:hypothetical protein
MVDKVLFDYVEGQLNKGVDEDVLRGALIEKGWSKEDIGEAIFLVSSNYDDEQKVKQILQGFSVTDAINNSIKACFFSKQAMEKILDLEFTTHYFVISGLIAILLISIMETVSAGKLIFLIYAMFVISALFTAIFGFYHIVAKYLFGGREKFTSFVRVASPVTFIAAIVALVLLPIVYLTPLSTTILGYLTVIVIIIGAIWFMVTFYRVLRIVYSFSVFKAIVVDFSPIIFLFMLSVLGIFTII